MICLAILEMLQKRAEVFFLVLPKCWLKTEWKRCCWKILFMRYLGIPKHKEHFFSETLGSSNGMNPLCNHFNFETKKTSSNSANFANLKVSHANIRPRKLINWWLAPEKGIPRGIPEIRKLETILLRVQPLAFWRCSMRKITATIPQVLQTSQLLHLLGMPSHRFSPKLLRKRCQTS